MSRGLVAARTLFPALLGITAGAALVMASPQDAPTAAGETFDAVSIKRASPDGPRGYWLRPGGRIDSQGQTIVGLIRLAYGAREVVGGPEWLRQDLYTVQTTASGNPDSARVAIMTRHMLADRFKLAAHIERRDLPVYALKVARADGRLGPNLSPHSSPCQPGTLVSVSSLPPAFARDVGAGIAAVPCGGTPFISGSGMSGIAISMSRVAQIVEQFWLFMPVRDQTGLTGIFDVRVENMINQWGNRAPTVDGAPSDAASLPAALQEQLGLRIEQGREPADVVVIDHLERPTEN